MVDKAIDIRATRNRKYCRVQTKLFIAIAPSASVHTVTGKSIIILNFLSSAFTYWTRDRIRCHPWQPIYVDLSIEPRVRSPVLEAELTNRWRGVVRCVMWSFCLSADWLGPSPSHSRGKTVHYKPLVYLRAKFILIKCSCHKELSPISRSITLR